MICDNYTAYPSPLHQCKVTLNTISPRMKSTSRVEVSYPLAAGRFRFKEIGILLFLKQVILDDQNTT